MNKGKLIVLSAPSGCGKSAILDKILKNKYFRCAVSATTRVPRNGEINGVNYYFLTVDNFQKKISENAFLEYTEYCGNYYGTLFSEVDDYIENGVNIILEIEIQGWIKVKKVRPDMISIFIVPPSISELYYRLNKRGTESKDVINKRISVAANEVMYAKKYDYIIVNDIIENTVRDFFSVIRAEQLKAEFQSKLIYEVIKNV